jgi:hypothetical protein
VYLCLGMVMGSLTPGESYIYIRNGDETLAISQAGDVRVIGAAFSSGGSALLSYDNWIRLIHRANMDPVLRELLIPAVAHFVLTDHEQSK